MSDREILEATKHTIEEADVPLYAHWPFPPLTPNEQLTILRRAASLPLDRSLARADLREAGLEVVEIEPVVGRAILGEGFVPINPARRER